MTYYVSPDGNDETNSGIVPEQPFRTLTRTIEKFAEDYGPDGPMVPVTVQLAVGIYSRDTEVFPILIPAGVEVRGAGRESTILEFGLPLPINTCDGRPSPFIYLQGSISDLSILSPSSWGEVAEPRDWPGNWVIEHEEATLARITTTLGTTVKHARSFHDVTAVTDAANSPVLGIGEGFEQDGEIWPLVEDCSVDDLKLGGGRVERCNLQLIRVDSPSNASIRGNMFSGKASSHAAMVIVANVSEELSGDQTTFPLFADNTFEAYYDYEGSLASYGEGEAERLGYGVNSAKICGSSNWQGNTMTGFREFYISDTPHVTFEENEIEAYHIDVGTHPWLTCLSEYPPSGNPSDVVFRHNTLRQGRFKKEDCEPEGAWYYGEYDHSTPLLRLNSSAQVVLENNSVSCAAGFLRIDDNAFADLGGGERSQGGNTFSWRGVSSIRGNCYYHFADIEIDVGPDYALTLYAKYNTWETRDAVIEIVNGENVVVEL